MSKEENPPKYAYATDLIQEVMVKASEYFRVQGIQFLPNRSVAFRYYLSDNNIQIKLFTSFKDFIIFLESLETYKVGDKLKVGEVTYMICRNNSIVFLINLDTGNKYGLNKTRRLTSDLSRSDVKEMFNWHSDVEFVKVN